jgi:hypothetical protein
MEVAGSSHTLLPTCQTTWPQIQKTTISIFTAIKALKHRVAAVALELCNNMSLIWATNLSYINYNLYIGMRKQFSPLLFFSD